MRMDLRGQIQNLLTIEQVVQRNEETDISEEISCTKQYSNREEGEGREQQEHLPLQEFSWQSYSKKTIKGILSNRNADIAMFQ